MAKVTIIQRVLPHYRIPLFRLMAEELKAVGIEFRLVYGQEYPGTVPHTIAIGESWAHRINNRYFNLADRQLVWQPCLDLLHDSELLIFEQASSLMVNYWLLLKRLLGWPTQLAYWGHGKNMQSSKAGGFSENLKRSLLTGVDWWFAYTDITSTIISAAGFPTQKVTVLQNAIDITSLKRAVESITPEAASALRNKLGLAGGEQVGLFCGGMHFNKRLDFLLEACQIIRRLLPNFHILLIGDGPEQYRVEEAVAQREWIHYLGPKFGADRAAYFRLADVFLMPGLVGLAILDSFAAGLPLFTTDVPIHSPEIAYLQNGLNGFVTTNSTQAYAESVCTYLLSGVSTRSKVTAACLGSADSFTLENMAHNFCMGIQCCLAQSGSIR